MRKAIDGPIILVRLGREDGKLGSVNTKAHQSISHRIKFQGRHNRRGFDSICNRYMSRRTYTDNKTVCNPVRD